MKEIKNINVLSLARIHMLFGALLGLVVGVLLLASGVPPGELFSSLIDSQALILIALTATYGAFGFIAGVINAWVYNLFAGWVGGIKIDLEDSK